MYHAISSINIDKKHSNLEATISKVARGKISTCMIQDPPSKVKQTITPGNNETVYRQISSDHAIAFNKSKANIIEESIITQNFNKASYATLLIQFANLNSQINLISIYIRPLATTTDVIRMLDRINSITRTRGYSRSILMGDTNSISPEWTPIEPAIEGAECHLTNNTSKRYNNIQLTRGRLLTNFCSIHKLQVLNNTALGHTYYNKHNKKTAYIDIMAAGNKITRSWKRICLEKIQSQGNLTEGHRMITLSQAKWPRDNTEKSTTILKLNDTNHTPNQTHNELEPRTQTKPKPNPNMNQNQPTPNSQQSHTFEKRQTNATLIDRMNQLAENLYKSLIDIQASQKRTMSNRKTKPSRNIISRETRMRKLAFKIRNGTSKNASTDRKIIKDYIRQRCNKRYNNKPNQNDPDNDIDLWETVKQCEVIIGDDNTTEPTVEMDNHIIESITNEKFPFIDRDRVRQLINKRDSMTSENNLPNSSKTPTIKEIDNAIYQLRNKKHTGHEGLKFTTFLQNIDNNKTIINEICTLSLCTSTIPNNCKTSLGKIIPKKKPGQFRIVHLATPLLCLIEQIILNQLQYQLEQTCSTDPRQYGFMPLKDRHDLITRIIGSHIINKTAIGVRKNTTIISLDIKGAFDNVSHLQLIEKLYQKLGKSRTITSWIANFLLCKNITLEYNKIRSQAKDICQGVPQGSCLGPLLWNFAIEDMIKNMNQNHNNNKQTEILSYADDLIIIHLNTKQEGIQEHLNTLISKLDEISLQVEPSKCSYMTTNPTDSIHYNKPKPITINNHQICQVKELTILGVSIKNNLTLNRQSIAQNDKLKSNITRLERLNSLGIIRSNEEWQILLDSYVRSLTTANNFPLLAVDPVSRKWIHEKLCKIYRYIFSWPQNISPRIIKLITHEWDIDIAIKKLIYKKLSHEEGLHYNLLLQMINSNSRIDRLTKKKVEIWIRESPPIKPHRVNRRFANPAYILETTEFNPRVHTNMWYLLNRQGGTIALNINQNIEITNEPIKYKHEMLPNEFFNNLATLRQLISTTGGEIGTKNIMMEQNNALLLAMKNFNNHDERIIDLREKMLEEGWKIIELTNEQATRTIQNKLHFLFKTSLKSLTTKTINEPNISDYVFKNNFKKGLHQVTEANKEKLITTFCKSIVNNPDAWSKLNPTWISGIRTLLLTGLTNRKNGQLTHFSKLEKSCDCKIITTNNIILHNCIECETHKALKPSREEQSIIMEYAISQDKSTTITNILNHRTKQKTILKMLTKAAFGTVEMDPQTKQNQT